MEKKEVRGRTDVPGEGHQKAYVATEERTPLKEGEGGQPELDIFKKEEAEKSKTILEDPEKGKEALSAPHSLLKDGGKVELILVDNLAHHPDSPRLHPDKDIESLKRSIQKNGVLGKLLVTQPVGKETTRYIIDGNRILEVAKQLGHDKLPCLVDSAIDDSEIVKKSFEINEQRNSYNPIERATYFKKCKEKYGFTLKEMEADDYGKPATISNCIKLLNLPESVQQSLIDGKLTEAHGSALLKLEKASQQEKIAEQAIGSDCSAAKLKKQIARFMAKGRKSSTRKTYSANALDPDLEGIYMRDSRDMAEIPVQSVHFIAGSPPYALGHEFEKKYSFDVMFEETKEVLKECARVLMPGCIIAINFTDIQDFKIKKGATEVKEWKFTGPLIQNALRKYNIFLTDVIQWKKAIAWPEKMHLYFQGEHDHTSYRILRQTEQVLIFRKGGEREVPDAEIAIKSRLSQEQWKAYAPSVWDIKHTPGQNQKGHPCVYPEELCHRLIKMYSYEGDTVLDPWLGSGTTVKVARDLGRVGIGYERELKYKPVIMENLGIVPVAKSDLSGLWKKMGETAEPKDTHVENHPKTETNQEEPVPVPDAFSGVKELTDELSKSDDLSSLSQNSTVDDTSTSA